MTYHVTKKRVRRLAKRREGAAMLVVMLVLLMATATAIFSVHATSYEIRAAGHSRRAMQTQYVAHSSAVASLQWLSKNRDSVRHLMESRKATTTASGTSPLTLTHFHEPNLRPSDEGLRLKMENLALLDTAIGEPPVDRETLGGNRQAYDAFVWVDMYDRHKWPLNIPGCESSGDSPECMADRVTVTARGRLRVASGTDPAYDGRQYHEGASEVRAHALVRPARVD